MYFVVIGSFFFVFGRLLALNYGRAAERVFEFYSRFTPTVGTATPNTLRWVGRVWIPMGASAIVVGLLR